MAEDISTLVLRVQSDGIKDGTDQLNALTAAAAKAEGAARKLGTQVTQTEAASTKASGSARAMAEAEDTVTRAVGAATTAYQRKSVEQKRYIELWGQELKAYGQAQVEATKMNAAIDRQTAAYDKMWNAAQRMNSEFDKHAAAQAAADFDKAWDAANRMNKAFDDSVQAYGRMQAKANEMNAAWDANKKKVDENTGAHGGNAAAVREVMVLMHELSQGSMKRFGSSLMVLANQMDVIPKTMELMKAGSYGVVAGYAAMVLGGVAVVGVIGTIVAALVQGAHQQKAFNDALLQTGNYAGTTVDGLRAVAEAAAGTHMNIGVAKDATLQLAQTGVFTAKQMTLLAASATAVEEAFGVSTEKTVAQFEELSKLAITNTARSTNVIAQHTLQLNQHYHFLTTAQFEHIVMLEKQGKATEAAQFATETFAKVQKDRAEQSLQNLGYVAKAWHGIKNAISGAMDAIGKVGAKQTDAAELVALKAARKKLSQSFATDEAAANSPDIAAYDAAIKKLQTKVNSDKEKAEREGQDQLTKQVQIGAENRLNSMISMNDKEFKKNKELQELENDWKASSQQYQLENLKAYQAARQKIMDDSQPKIKGNDTRVTDRDTEVDHIKSANQDKLDAIQGYISASKELARKEDHDRRAELAEREWYYKDERKAIEDALKAELAVYDKFQPKTKEEGAVNARKRKAAVDKAESQTTAVDRAEQADINNVRGQEYEELDKLDKKYQQTYQAEAKRIEDLTKAERIRLSGINELKSTKMDTQAREEDSQADKLQHEYELRQGMINLMEETGLWDSRRVAVEESGLASLKKEIAGRRELADIHRQEAGQQRNLEDFQRTTKYLNTAIAAGKQFEKALTQAFGNVGKAIGGMSTAFLEMMKDKNDAQAYYNSLSKADQDNEENKAALRDAQTNAAISGYANMAESAKGFFNAKSKGAIIADGIAKGLHAAELARNAIKMVSNLATGASAMFAQSGWGGFAGVAAMAAVMAAFGVSVAGSHNSGGMSAADMQKTQGTGSVFGDMGTKNSDGTTTYKTQSDSITKAMDTLKNNSNAMLPVNEAMLKSLQNIEAAMVGLTNLVVRTTGLTDGTNMGIQTGTLSRGVGGVGGSILGNGAGMTLAGAAGGFALGSSMTLIGSVMGPIGAAVGALAGVVVSKLASLWGKTTQNIVDSGLQFGGTVGALRNGSGYNQYASVDTTKSSWFGLSKSTSNSVQTQGLSQELSQQFGLIFSGVEDSMKAAASALGKDGDAVGKAIDNMVIDTTKISLKGLSGDDLTKAINAVISKTMDDIAQTAFPQMDAFRQVGEGYAQTVVRVASGIEQANVALKTLGITAISYQDIQNKTGDVAFQMVQQSIELKEAGSGIGQMVEYMTGSVSDLSKAYQTLVDTRSQMKRLGLGDNLNVDTVNGSGGADALSKNLQTYQEKYFNASEQVNAETEKLTAQFNAFGTALPSSRAQLRSWIEAAASTGDQLKVGQLLSLAGAFDTLETSIESLATTTSSAFDDNAVSAAKTAYDDAVTAAENAFSALQKSVDAQKTVIQKAQDDLKTTASSITDVLTNVADALKATAPSAQTFAQGMDVVQSAIQTIITGGDITKVSGLSDAINTISKQSTDSYSSAVDYKIAQAKANSALTELQAVGNGQLDAVQRQIDLDQKQLDSLDDIVKTAQTQLDALKGINDSVLSVSAALQGFATALQAGQAAQSTYNATKAGQTGGTSGAVESLYNSLLGRPSDAAGKAFWVDAIDNKGASVSSVSTAMQQSVEYESGFLDKLYQTVLGRAPDAAGKAWWLNAMQNGATQADVTNGFYNSSEYGGLPSFDSGTNVVPNDMIAQIHKGERIIPAADNAKLMQALNTTSGSGDNASLIQKIDDLIEVIQTGDVANVQKSNEVFKIVREWNLNGMPQVRQQQ